MTIAMNPLYIDWERYVLDPEFYRTHPTVLYEEFWVVKGQYMAESDYSMSDIQMFARRWVESVLTELPEQVTRYRLRNAVKVQFMAAFTQEANS